MSSKSAERLFKFVFRMAIVIAIFFIIGIFLLMLKVILLFVPELHIMGLTIIQ